MVRRGVRRGRTALGINEPLGRSHVPEGAGQSGRGERDRERDEGGGVHGAEKPIGLQSAGGGMTGAYCGALAAIVASERRARRRKKPSRSRSRALCLGVISVPLAGKGRAELSDRAVGPTWGRGRGRLKVKTLLRHNVAATSAPGRGVSRSVMLAT